MNKAVHPNQLRQGDHVREYLIQRRLAVGGFSLVFLVEHEGSPYVMKMALQPASDEEEDLVDGWMRREAVSLEHLAHPNLLPVYELGRWPDPRTGYSFYVTDHVPGATFHDWRWNKRATPYQWVGVLIGILQALEAMHERGVCHRDLKADNILVREGDDWPFLIDLGAVHLPCARPLTEGISPGTLYCQPPEAIRFLLGKEALKKGSRFEARPAADLYAVGILVYEALTGLRPFDPDMPLKQLLVAILTVSLAEPQQHNPEVPASLSALAMRLLAKDPAQRPASARAVREELERLRSEEGHTAPWQVPSVPLSEKGKEGGEPEGGGAPVPEDGGAEGGVPEGGSAPVQEGGSAPVQEGGSAPVQEGGSAPVQEGKQTEPIPAGAPEASGRVGYCAERWPEILVALVLVLGLLGLGWGLLHHHVESTAPTSPTPSEQGAPPVPSSQNTHDPSATDTSPEASSRWCAMLHAVWGVALAQLVGCVTTPAVRPDPAGFLARCSPEARATPIRLGFKLGHLHPTYLASGTPASSARPREEGGPLNVKPGPVTAYMFPMVDETHEFVVAGEAETTRMRVYIRFDRIQLPDGSWLPICGAAVSTYERVYGIPTYEGVVMTSAPLDQVDRSPGSVIINRPRFETAIEPPEGEPRANVRQVDPEALPDIEFVNPPPRQHY
ncbi:serine/threonine-protein kinase [Archangium sp.]|uniref:serine/threonine protein kinase n=1 Tax=Archangium sp. TaxID=1872627 RepID=UPI002D460B1C|nr:serine/threonine-protein kinase [Archangium sp.]HYO54001.1 serine/threonine-protein kinase [Archangium sp.]